MKMKTQLYKIFGMQQKKFQREVHMDTVLPQETRKISNEQPNLPPKRIRKTTKKPQSQQKEENNKDQRGNKQINKIEI